MKFVKSTANVFVPDHVEIKVALERTTHLCIVAHQDDAEIAAYNGIAECFGRADRWFTTVIVTNGAGSARTGIYGHFTDEEMQKIRRTEQQKAAMLGEYGAVIQLDYSSKEVKDGSNLNPVQDLLAILEATQPDVIYTHQPADKHDTHIGVFSKALAAMRQSKHPFKKVFGCECWRDLDWLCDDQKVVMDCSAYPNMASALVGVFDSQVSGGKRYDLAAIGRRLCHATFLSSHSADTMTAVNFAMDLMPLVKNPEMPVSDFIIKKIQQFEADVRGRLANLGMN